MRYIQSIPGDSLERIKSYFDDLEAVRQTFDKTLRDDMKTKYEGTLGNRVKNVVTLGSLEVNFAKDSLANAEFNQEFYSIMHKDATTQLKLIDEKCKGSSPQLADHSIITGRELSKENVTDKNSRILNDNSQRIEVKPRSEGTTKISP